MPPACYRAGVDRDPDALLENQGIMHLHLGGRDSDVLVFLILYSDRVVLLASNTHVHFRTRPPGKNILALTQSWLGNLEREMHEAAVAAEASTVAAEREAAKARRAKLAASRAACKAKTGIV